MVLGLERMSTASI